MKTGQSGVAPQKVLQSNGKWQIAYDILPFEKETFGSVQKGFSYSYAEIDGPLSRSSIIDAVISNEYTKDAEIALINNQINGSDTGEYAGYQAVRAKAKAIAADVIGVSE